MHMGQIDGPVAGDTAVQQGDGVPHGAVAQAGQQQSGIGGQGDPFGPGDVEQPVPDHLGPDAAEIIALAAGEDGGGHLVDLCGGQDKKHMFRRLLQGLQQGVEGAGGKHVHFVDDIGAHLSALTGA